jgi:hypothetical protein
VTLALVDTLVMPLPADVSAQTLQFSILSFLSSKLLSSYTESDPRIFHTDLCSCPYVTAVGATKVYPGHTVFEPESAANDLIGQPWRRAYSTAGGFSNVYDVPSYQTEAVASYFEHYNPPYKYYNGNSSFGANGGVYNRNGRGIPDVSANGDNIAVFLEGNFTINGGTSAATPIFASIITLVSLFCPFPGVKLVVNEDLDQ